MSEFKEIAAEEREAKYAEAAELCRGSFVKEKVAAARALGVRTVVIRRPVESGASMEEILREVRSLTRLRHEDPAVCT